MSEKDHILTHCVVTPTDKMATYDTTAEMNQHLFAFVLTNERGQKISVLLNSSDARKIRDQLTDFIGE